MRCWTRCSNSARSRDSSLRHDLAGVEDTVRVEELLDAAVERHEIAVLLLQVAELAEADSVLARARPATGQRVVDQRRVQRLGPGDRRGVVRIEQKRDVEVAVADVPDD